MPRHQKRGRRAECVVWECWEGHTWLAPRVSSLRGGAWCSVCCGRGHQAPPIGHARALAEERGGACLSARVVTASLPLEWRCAAGHTWAAPLKRIARGSWCLVCSGRTQRGRARLSLDDAREAAARRGGACLAESYVLSVSLYAWRCAAGHTWEATLDAVRNRGAWCPECRAPLAASRTQAATLAACSTRKARAAQARRAEEARLEEAWYAGASQARAEEEAWRAQEEARPEEARPEEAWCAEEALPEELSPEVVEEWLAVLNTGS